MAVAPPDSLNRGPVSCPGVRPPGGVGAQVRRHRARASHGTPAGSCVPTRAYLVSLCMGFLSPIPDISDTEATATRAKSTPETDDATEANACGRGPRLATRSGDSLYPAAG